MNEPVASNRPHSADKPPSYLFCGAQFLQWNPLMYLPIAHTSLWCEWHPFGSGVHQAVQQLCVCSQGCAEVPEKIGSNVEVSSVTTGYVWMTHTCSTTRCVFHNFLWWTRYLSHLRRWFRALLSLRGTFGIRSAKKRRSRSQKGSRSLGWDSGCANGSLSRSVCLECGKYKAAYCWFLNLHIRNDGDVRRMAYWCPSIIRLLRLRAGWWKSHFVGWRWGITSGFQGCRLTPQKTGPWLGMPLRWDRRRDRGTRLHCGGLRSVWCWLGGTRRRRVRRGLSHVTPFP